MALFKEDLVSLDVLQDKYKSYIDNPIYVYGNIENRGIIIYKKLDDTITDENRDGIFDEKNAKYTADKLQIEKIISFDNSRAFFNRICGIENNPEEKSIKEVNSLIEHYKSRILSSSDNFGGVHKSYCVGNVVYFEFPYYSKDKKLNYFKTLERAYNEQIVCLFTPEYLRISYYDNGRRKCVYDESTRRCINWHENGVKKNEYSHDENIKINGLYQEWHDNGKLYRQHNYVDGIPNGTITEWYSNGQKSLEYNAENDVIYGQYSEWHENGKKKTLCNYVNGVINGVYKEWHDNGELKCECVFVNGKIEGKLARWHSNGKMFVICDFKNGEIKGTFISFHDNEIPSIISTETDTKIYYNNYRLSTKFKKNMVHYMDILIVIIEMETKKLAHIMMEVYWIKNLLLQTKKALYYIPEFLLRESHI